MGTTAIFANPGQTVRIVVQTVDGYGARVDGYVPTVQSVYFPDLSLATGYPLSMTKIDTGLYAHGLVLPSGVTALGTFIASTYYNNGIDNWDLFIINVARPFGNSSVSPG